MITKNRNSSPKEQPLYEYEVSFTPFSYEKDCNVTIQKFIRHFIHCYQHDIDSNKDCNIYLACDKWYFPRFIARTPTDSIADSTKLIKISLENMCCGIPPIYTELKKVEHLADWTKNNFIPSNKLKLQLNTESDIYEKLYPIFRYDYTIPHNKLPVTVDKFIHRVYYMFEPKSMNPKTDLMRNLETLNEQLNNSAVSYIQEIQLLSNNVPDENLITVAIVMKLMVPVNMFLLDIYNIVYELINTHTDEYNIYKIHNFNGD